MNFLEERVFESSKECDGGNTVVGELFGVTL
jgi:hypothetical protein